MKQDTILIVEEDKTSREGLTGIFQDKYKILEAPDGKEGLMLLRSNLASLAAVLVNISIVVKDDFRVFDRLREKKILSTIPFIVLTSDKSFHLEKKVFEYGVVSHIRSPYPLDAVRPLVDNVIELFQNKVRTEIMLKHQSEKLYKQNNLLKAMLEKQKHVNEILVSSLSNIVEFRNLESEQHIKRIQELCICLGTNVMKLYPEYELTPEKLELIGWASSLHDIGKIVIPDHIILKAGKLTDDEYEVIKSHTTKGAEIIEKVIKLENRAFCNYAYDIARHHHEKYDGNGYPDGLKGEEISIAAQIVSLVDVYDALTSKRVYKAAYDTDKAYQMIINGQSGAFSPKLLQAFTESREEFETIVKKFKDED